MRKPSFGASLLLLVAAAVNIHCQNDAIKPRLESDSDKTEWKEFSSKEGKFSAKFPGTPKVSVSRNAEGRDSTTVLVEMDNGIIGYVVAYDELGDDGPVDAKAALGDFMKLMAAGTKSKKDIMLNGFPGVEFIREIEVEGNKLYFRAHVYVVKNRLYRVFVMAEQSKKDKLETDKFLESFRLSEKAEEKKEPGK
jgi:hypothetical protein